MTSVRLLAKMTQSPQASNCSSPLLAPVPLAVVLEAAKSPRRKRPEEWSRGYRVFCLAIALLVGASPLLLIGVAMGVMGDADSDGDSDSGVGSRGGAAGALATTVNGVNGRGSSSTPSSSSARCATFPVAHGVNGTFFGSRSGGSGISGGGGDGGGGGGSGSSSSGKVLAMALLLEEGPRGEYRRKAREAIAVTRASALARGLVLYAFPPCAVRPGTSALLAGTSAAVACKLSEEITSHRCAPQATQPPCDAAGGTVGGRAQGTKRRLVSSSSSSGGGGGGSVAPVPVLEVACSSALAAPPVASNGTRRVAQPGVVVDGCCAPPSRSRKQRLSGRGLHSHPFRKGRMFRWKRRRMLEEMASRQPTS